MSAPNLPQSVWKVAREDNNYPCKCGGAMWVIDSRRAAHGIRRRRLCKKCGARVTTYELEKGHEPKFLEILQAISAEHDVIGGKIAMLLEQAKILGDLDETHIANTAPPHRGIEGRAGRI